VDGLLNFWKSGIPPSRQGLVQSPSWIWRTKNLYVYPYQS